MLEFDMNNVEEELKRQLDQMRLLLDVTNKITSHLELRELFKAIADSIHQLIDCDGAGMTLYDPQSRKLRIYALEPRALGVGKSPFDEGELVPMEGTPGGLAFHSLQTVLITPANLKSFPSPVMKQAIANGIRSGCVAPLISRGKALGTLDVASLREDAFTQGDASLLTQVANQIAIAVENALAYREIEALKNKLTQEKLYLEEELQSAWNFEQIIGRSPAFKRILKQVETVAPTDSTVLIQGETGTGKEIIARAIHNLSTRRDRTVVKLNCAAIPTGLIESELFGHEKGAFTGAITQRIGRFELAHRGTLFLDEVGEIPLELQPKLLRVLQEQEFERLGSTRTQRVDVRLVAATNRDLAQMVESNQFRRDLYYRLNVFPLTIPPLRERPEDIPLLVRFFASKFASRMRKRIETIPAEAMAALTNYHWPGNIRELENLIERATILSQGPRLEIQLTELKSKTKAEPLSTTTTTLEAAEREHILRMLRETNWVVGGPTGAAARLGMKRTTLQSKMRKLGINR
jgi:formate hydrogenlyase transcriptional activator